MKIKEKRIVGISLSSIYCELGEELKYNSINHTKEDGEDYYDLIDGFGTILCMDGEECEILKETNDHIELFNFESDLKFKLSKQEFGIANYS